MWRSSLEMHPRDDTECLRDVQMSRTLVLPTTFQPISSIHSKFEENQSPEKQPCCSSPMVDVFLSGPSAISLNALDSPYLCSKKTENASQEMDGRCSMITENQTNFDHNESAGALAPFSSSSLNKFIANSLGTSDFPNVQLKQNIILPRDLLDDRSYSEGNIVDFHWSKVHKYTSVKAENKLKATFPVKESNEMSYDEQRESVFANTDICRALPAGSQNEKRMMEQKRIDMASFQSMNNQNLTYGTPNNTGSFLYCHKHMGVDISGNPELGLNFKFTEGSLLDVHAIEKSFIRAENLLFYDEEASQHHCAMRKRRRFQDTENHGKIPGFEKQIRNFKSNVSDAESAENLMGKYTSDTPIVEPTKASSSTQYVQSTVKTGMSCKMEGGSYVTVPNLFFVGLDSNTLGSVGQATHTDTQLTERDIFEGDMPFSCVNDLVVQTSKDQLLSTSLNSQISFSTMANEGKIFHSGTTDDNDIMFGGRNLNEELPISSDGYQALFNRYLTPPNIKTSPAENFNSAAIVSQSSSREKRKKGAKNEGQNFCNCKRSQCLKLYCRCFAAGTICTEACGCHECFNISQYEETILKTRNQIESRNPLAFAPKIFLGAFDPSNNNEECISSTPSSTRHKRGCNCRKSLCLKKYCECFQAGVGCSPGCHCFGCKNTFGRKDGELVGSSEAIEMKHEKPKEENLEMESSVNRVEKMEVSKAESSLRLSPLTPSIECSNGTGADSPTPLLHRRDSSPRSPIRSIGDIKFEDEELDSLFPYNQERNCDTAATLSPRWDDFQDLFNLSPLVSLPPRGGGDAGTSDASEAEIPQGKSPQGHATSPDGSLQSRCSPVTPPPQLGESKILPEPNTSIGALATPADDVLDATPFSSGAVKLNSPMQKRTSQRKRALDTTPGLRNLVSSPCIRNKEDGTT